MKALQSFVISITENHVEIKSCIYVDKKLKNPKTLRFLSAERNPQLSSSFSIQEQLLILQLSAALSLICPNSVRIISSPETEHVSSLAP